MKSKLLFVVFLLMISHRYSTAQKLAPGEIEFEGVEYFWNIVEKIEKNNEPTIQDWDQLFGTVAYNYLAKESGRELIIDRISIAYSPQKASERNEILTKNNYESMILEHLNKARSNRIIIEKYTDSLRHAPLLSNSLKDTQKYLPKHFINRHKDAYPSLAFAIFEPDGKANNEIIVVDVAFARQIDLKLFLAHEAHHFFISKIRKQMKSAEDNMEYILKTIRQLHLEGIADLIDKRGILTSPETLSEDENWYAYHYKNYYNNARQTFSKIDHLIQNYNVSGNEDIGESIWKTLHFGTHPEAMHMALLIEKAFGRQHIITLLENPFDYLRSYQKAAILYPDEGWVFSDASMSFFNGLEKSYLIH